MALSGSLGLARKVLKKAYVVESAKVPDQSKMLIGRVDNTTQKYELYKQLAGYAPAERTNEGDQVKFDSLQALYTLTLTPYLVTKGTRFSKLAQFVTQYKDLLAVAPAWARAFRHKRNQVAADMFNNGFTSGNGMINSEALFATSHAMGTGGPTFSNRPATDIAFSPSALKQAMTELRKQKSARNTPQPVLSKLRVVLPPALEGAGVEVINSLLSPNTNDNNTNEWVRNRCESFICDYLTSDAQWFVLATDPDEHGLVWLDQMDYDIEKLARDASLMDTWVASESYAVGAYDAHGTWGTVGA